MGRKEPFLTSWSPTQTFGFDSKDDRWALGLQPLDPRTSQRRKYVHLEGVSRGLGLGLLLCLCGRKGANLPTFHDASKRFSSAFEGFENMWMLGRRAAVIGRAFRERCSSSRVKVMMAFATVRRLVRSNQDLFALEMLCTHHVSTTHNSLCSNLPIPTELQVRPRCIAHCQLYIGSVHMPDIRAMPARAYKVESWTLKLLSYVGRLYL